MTMTNRIIAKRRVGRIPLGFVPHHDTLRHPRSTDYSLAGNGKRSNASNRPEEVSAIRAADAYAPPLAGEKAVKVLATIAWDSPPSGLSSNPPVPIS